MEKNNELQSIRKKLNQLVKVIKNPREWNSELASYGEVKELETRIEEVEKISHEPQDYKEKCEAMEKKIHDLEKEVKKILYVIGK
tara:strand:+ start:1222 stop:1476 length:255 start_codon:yes stop_codon:yes gene_type:complete